MIKKRRAFLGVESNYAHISVSFPLLFKFYQGICESKIRFVRSAQFLVLLGRMQLIVSGERGQTDGEDVFIYRS